METLMGLLEGNADHARASQDRFDHLQDGQRPDAVTVCCSDSRVLQDHIWGNDDPGRLFSCSNIGNRVVQQPGTDRVVSGDVLYPIEHTGTETVVIVGHTGCGAVTATYDSLTDGLDEPPGIEHCVELLEPQLRAGVSTLPPGLDRTSRITHLVEYNVDRQVEFLERSAAVPAAVDVFGVVYDFQDAYDGRRGEVHVINVGGENSVDTLRANYPDMRSRIQRVWEYDA